MVNALLNRRNGRGFTVIELLVVLAVMALLLAIAAPRYAQHVDAAREAALRQDLAALRDAIDKYAADQGHYPATLADLATRHYLRAVPVDPFTERSDTWQAQGPASGDASSGVADVHSGAPGQARDGTSYASW
jgi:general secretion pathway protein G